MTQANDLCSGLNDGHENLKGILLYTSSSSKTAPNGPKMWL